MSLFMVEWYMYIYNVCVHCAGRFLFVGSMHVSAAASGQLPAPGRPIYYQYRFFSCSPLVLVRGNN